MTIDAVQQAVREARSVEPSKKANPAPAVAYRPRTLDVVMADAIDDADVDFDDELVEGVVGRNSMAVLYGDTNSGKTFLAIDMICSISRSADWMGRPTDGGLVVYLATESPGSVLMRIKAYQRHHRVRLPLVAAVKSPLNFFDGSGDVNAVIALVEQLEEQNGQKVVLIVGDTLARLAVGANENAGDDMGLVVQRIDAIRASTGAAFLLIHHCGKDAARGARGWSGLKAAVDTEIEIASDEATGMRSAEITKQRDLPGKGARIGFRLEPVPLGRNQWGTVRTSCVVIPTEAPPKVQRSKRISEIAGAVIEFLTQRGSGCLKGALVKHFEGRYVKTSVYKELRKLIEGGLLIEVAGVVALPGLPVSNVSNVVQDTNGQPVNPVSNVSSPFRGGHNGHNGHSESEKTDER